MNQNKHLTLLVIVVGLSAVGYLFNITNLPFIAFWIGLVSLTIPPLGDLVIKIWEKLAMALGWFNSRVLLSIIFYLFLFPIALLSRIGKKDKLRLHLKKDSENIDSFFTTRNHQYNPKDLENPW